MIAGERILMDTKKLSYFLNELEENKSFYKLDKVRNEAIMLEVAVPGQCWEVKFMEDGSIKIEKFISNADFLYDESGLKTLF